MINFTRSINQTASQLATATYYSINNFPIIIFILDLLLDFGFKLFGDLC